MLKASIAQVDKGQYRTQYILDKQIEIVRASKFK